MAFQLNEKLKTMTPYDPIDGDYPIRLDANESFLQPEGAPRQAVLEAAGKAALNRYPDPLAREACRRFAEYYHLNPEFVTAGNGSDELISVLMNAFLQKGNKVLTLSPDFSMYQFYTSVVECPCVTLKKNADYSIPVEAVIETLKTEKIRMLIFSNPCNPTSLGLSAREVRRIIQSTDALVVLDEAYMDFWDQSLLSEAERYDNLVILRTCSKALGLAAIRLGFAVANARITNAIRAVKSPYNVNAVTQAMAAAALSFPEYLDECKAKVLASRDALYGSVKKLAAEYPHKLQVAPTNTNFVFLAMPNAEELFEILKQNGIIVRYMGGHLRVSSGKPEENAAFLSVLEQELRKGESK